MGVRCCRQGGVTLAIVVFTVALVPTVVSAQCDCTCHADPVCDGVTDVFDVLALVDEVFRGRTTAPDPMCPHSSRSDVDCDCAIDVFDMVAMIDVAFRAIVRIDALGPCRRRRTRNHCKSESDGIFRLVRNRSHHPADKGRRLPVTGPVR
jgi:hypothetical protein